MIGFVQMITRLCPGGTLRKSALALTLLAGAVFFYWRGYDAAADHFEQAQMEASLKRQRLHLDLMRDESHGAEADRLALRNFEDDFKTWHASDCFLDDDFLERLREAFPQSQ